MTAIFDLHIQPTADAVVSDAVARFVQAADLAIRERGRFNVALSGGRTALAFHQQLATTDGISWPKVHIFFGDERCVGPEHADSNYGAARDSLLSKVPIPADQIHRMRGELEPEEGAEGYERTMRDALGPDGRLDLILLGMGGDGHTGSIFPGSDTMHATAPVVATPVATQPPHVRRLTLTFPAMAAARARLLLITGADKAHALNRALTDPSANLPVQRLPADTTVVADRAAASKLSR